MKNAKRILTLLVVLAMAFGCMFALAACKPDEPDGPDTPDTPSTPGEIPTEDGKITLYFTIKNEGEMTSINSYFICGTPNKWTEGNLDYELKRLGETDTYYVFMDPAVAKDAEYKIVVGWNETSGAPASQQGPFWTSEGYGPWPANSSNSFVPEFADGAKTVKCIFNDKAGEREESETFTFNGCKGEPEKIKDFDLNVYFKKGQTTADSKVYIIGVKDWDVAVDGTNLAKRTEGETADKYTVTVDEMYARDAVDYLVIVFPNGLGETITDAKDDKDQPKTADIWDYYGVADRGGIKIADNGKNIDLGSKLDGFKVRDGYVDLANSSEEKPLDLELKTKDEGGLYLLDINADKPMLEVTLKVTFDNAIPEDLFVYLAGEGTEGLAWGDTTVKMTGDSDRKVFTTQMSIREGTVINFKVVICGTTWSWDVAYGNGDGNATVTITEAGVVELFSATQTYTAAA